MKKTFAILIAVMILLSVMPISVFAEELLLETLEGPYRDNIHRENISMVEAASTEGNPVTAELKEYIHEQISQCAESIDISKFNIYKSEENINDLIFDAYYETPEFFHIYGLSYSVYSSGKIASLMFKYRMTEEEYYPALDEMNRVTAKLTADITKTNSLTEVEKALILHDRLALWTEYDIDVNSKETPQEKIIYTAYGILVNQLGVCQGYALAYDYLLQQVGIESKYCVSSALNHAWNIVTIDGIEYHVDVTHDDPIYDVPGRVYHTNFLRSTDGIKSTSHDATDFISTPNDTRYDSYYWQNINSAFQYANNHIYYIDNSKSTLYKITNGQSNALLSLETQWFIPDMPGYYYGNNSKLVSDGVNLYYSNSTKVHKYNTSSGTTSVIWDLGSQTNKIYGLKLENCKLYCTLFGSPNFESTTVAENTIQTICHCYGEKWIIEKFATSESNGTTYKECVGCGERQTGTTTTNANEILLATDVTTNGTSTTIFTEQLLTDNATNLIKTTLKSSIPSFSRGNTNFYGTGSQITVNLSADEEVTLTIIVNGDLNGDSVCDVLDAQLTALYSNGLKTPSESEIYAANGSESTSIDATSYQAVVNKMMAQ